MKTSKEQLREAYEEWQDYNVRVIEHGLNRINIQSWFDGCPRVSGEMLDKLDELKKASEITQTDIDKAIEEARKGG